MQTFVQAAPAIYWSLASFLSARQPAPCLCECRTVHQTDERLLDILREQLARCGPENLGSGQPNVYIFLGGLVVGLVSRELAAIFVRRLRELGAASGASDAVVAAVRDGALAVTPSRR